MIRIIDERTGNVHTANPSAAYDIAHTIWQKVLAPRELGESHA